VVVPGVDDVGISCVLACDDVEAPLVCLRHQFLRRRLPTYELFDLEPSREGRRRRRHDDGCQQWAAGARVV